jgi:hypothetical protein
MSTGSGSTISDAPVTARAIDIYELSGILLPGILVAAAALLSAHLAYPKELTELARLVEDHQKWETVMTVLMLSTFFAISYLLGQVCVIFGYTLFNTLITDVLVGPPLVVLALPHLSPAYRRSPRAAIARLVMFSLVGLVIAPQLASWLGGKFPELARTLQHCEAAICFELLVSRNFWTAMAVSWYLVYLAYQGYERHVAAKLGILSRTDINRAMIAQIQKNKVNTALGEITRRMEFDMFTSSWAILPLASLDLLRGRPDRRCRSVDKHYRDSSNAMSDQCRRLVCENLSSMLASMLLTVPMAVANFLNLFLRMLENAFLKTLLCLRPLSSYSLMHVLGNFRVIRRSPGSLDMMSGVLAHPKDVEAYYAVAVDDSFRLLLSQVLANIGDSTAEKNHRNHQLFRIVLNACGAMVAITMLFSVFSAPPLSARLSLAAALLAFILLLRAIFLRYQVYERELYIAFGGMPIELLHKYFDQSEKPHWRRGADGKWVQAQRD